MVLLHFPDVWLDYAAWHAEGGGGGTAAAQAVLTKARKALPACLAVQFAAADALEVAGSATKAKEIYETLVEHLRPAEEGGAAGGAAALATAGSGAAAAAAAAAAGDGAGSGGASSGGAADDGGAASPGGAGGAAPPAAAAASGGLGLSAEQGTLAWIQYMRFARRSEGITAARKVRRRCRRAVQRCRGSWREGCDRRLRAAASGLAQSAAGAAAGWLGSLSWSMPLLCLPWTWRSRP